VVLLSDDEIRAAQEALWRVLRIVTEPGGAAALAAAMRGAFRGRVGVIVCGGNTTAVDFTR
jgi:threonine dehydratase